MYDLLNESTENVIERMGFGKRMQEVGLVVPLEYTVITTDKMTTITTFTRVKKEKRKVQTLNKTENPVSKTTLPTKEKYSHNLVRYILHLLFDSQTSTLFQHYFSNRHPF